MLSKRVACVLQSLKEAHSATATFILQCDRFFDCLNGQTERSTASASDGSNRDLLAYTDLNDTRFQVNFPDVCMFSLWILQSAWKIGYWCRHCFQFLKDFLKYLSDWKTSVDIRTGFTNTEKETMFLAAPTYEGIQTTGFTFFFLRRWKYYSNTHWTSLQGSIYGWIFAVNGFIGATMYLLEHGVTAFKSNIFCQDPLENRFGRHCGLGERSRNPSMKEYV